MPHAAALVGWRHAFIGPKPRADPRTDAEPEPRPDLWTDAEPE